MPTEYNPGEYVFDPLTGEPYITEDGDLVEVSPGLKVNRPDGTVLSGDDVANAAWYRANKWLGETLRDRSIGVPFSEILGQADSGLVMASVIGEVRERTPGVVGVLGVQLLDYSPITRVLQWRATLIRADNDTTDMQGNTILP